MQLLHYQFHLTTLHVEKSLSFQYNKQYDLYNKYFKACELHLLTFNHYLKRFIWPVILCNQGLKFKYFIKKNLQLWKANI